MEHADVVELADTTDLNSVVHWTYEFESHHRHQQFTLERMKCYATKMETIHLGTISKNG